MDFRIVASLTMMISRCWRSLLDGAERAHAQRRRTKSGAIGAGRVSSMRTMAGYFSSSFSPVSSGSISNSAPKRLSSAAFIVFEVALFGMNRLARVVEPAHERKVCSVILEDLQAFRYGQCRSWVIFERFSPVVAVSRPIRRGVAIIRSETAASGPSSAWQKYHSDCFFELHRRLPGTLH